MDADPPPSLFDSSNDDFIDPDSILDTAAFFMQLARETGVSAEILKECIRVCVACEKVFLVQYYYSHKCYSSSSIQASFMPPFPAI